MGRGSAVEQILYGPALSVIRSRSLRVLLPNGIRSTLEEVSEDEAKSLWAEEIALLVESYAAVEAPEQLPGGYRAWKLLDNTAVEMAIDRHRQRPVSGGEDPREVWIGWLWTEEAGDLIEGPPIEDLDRGATAGYCELGCAAIVRVGSAYLANGVVFAPELGDALRPLEAGRVSMSAYASSEI